MKKLIKVSIVAATMVVTGLVASDILATVDGKNITKQDAQNFVRATAPNANYDQLSPEQKDMITNRLVERVLFIEAAKKENIQDKPEFKENLEKVKDELLVSIWMKEQLDNAIVSESEAKEFYEANKAKFNMPPKLEARHILLKDEKTAKEIIAELKDLKGKELVDKFAELAKSKSTGPTGKDGGKLPPFTKGQMVPEFEAAAFALKDGQVTQEPVKTQFGYHVILLEKHIPSTPIAYENVKNKIMQSLKQKQFQTKLSEVAKELRAKSKIDMKKQAKPTSAQTIDSK
ncbi:Peptidyl-prolyl cis-trans isomerase PpiC [hydrothermal vent metagenome]|uniref:Peptidyl-prolyl cis-trans isomerase PpiC n=1 Tax=hydrothermal vent metagenome TaxID=652676 RepID=A0A1W1B8F2_9ZZZZ